MSDDEGALAGKDDAAHKMLNKLRRFMEEELSRDERQALSALLAPGVAAAYQDGEENKVDAEVTGFQATAWMPDTLPDYISGALRDRDWRLVGE